MSGIIGCIKIIKGLKITRQISIESKTNWNRNESAKTILKIRIFIFFIRGPISDRNTIP